MEIFSFPPISAPDSSILILGTMPGNKSLEVNEYYAHGGKQFWKILFDLFQESYFESYSRKISLLLSHHIALWDVLKACKRKSSADTDILCETPNDFDLFFEKHYKVRAIFFNGNKAAKYFQKIVLQSEPQSHILPSTSSANTWFTYKEKLNEWKAILDFI